MATSTYLASPNLTINSVSMQDQCHGLTFTRTIEALESTAFGSGSRVYVAGLENSTLSCDLYLSFAASETYATLKSACWHVYYCFVVKQRNKPRHGYQSHHDAYGGLSRGLTVRNGLGHPWPTFDSFHRRGLQRRRSLIKRL